MRREMEKDAQTKETPHPTRHPFVLLAFFYCGCKQPKSVHMISAAKVRISEHSTKEKSIFLRLSSNTIIKKTVHTHLARSRTVRK